MEKEIDILVVEPGIPPRPAKVMDTLDAFRKIVGGPIEAGCYLPKRVMLICNGEGKNVGLPPNRVNPSTGDYIAGTFFLCSFEGEHFASLTPAQQAEFRKYFAKPGEFMVIGTGDVCATRGELAMTACKLWDSMKNGESVVLTRWGAQRGGDAV